MKAKIAGLLTTALLFGALSAQATTLTFDGLTTAGAEDITLNNQGYGGLTWTTGNNWTLFSKTSYPVPTVSGNYGLVNNFGANPAIVSGSAFSFNSVEIVGWYFNAPTSVGIRAYDSSHNLIGDTGLVGINTSSYTLIAPNWSGVSELDFYGGQYFALDDMIINSVPEPATLSLLGLGLVGLGLMRKRRAS
jgi:hypothetical protein